MKLDRVTITGADDSVDSRDLIALSEEFPFVEWGILFSRSSHGARPRFPSSSWLTTHIPALAAAGAQLSAHLCGGWVRSLATGRFAWRDAYQSIGPRFQRIQLNFHSEPFDFGYTFGDILQLDGRPFIFQVDGVNTTAISQLVLLKEIGSPLFDLSAGAGVVPDSWPRAWPTYCGYAGGLGAHNVIAELERIRSVARDQRIWIDMERRVRTADDSALDLGLVRSVLDQVAPFISR